MQIDPRRTVQIRADFGQARFAILDQLMTSGIEQIAGQNLAALKASMSRAVVQVLPWTCVNEAPIGDLGAVRESAQWWRSASGQKFGVEINSTFWPPVPMPTISIADASTLKNILSLHESLGAVGVGDDGYRCSTRLWFLSKRQSVQSLLSDPEIQPIFKDTNILCANHSSQILASAGGGSTGIGGGGDDEEISGKVIAVIRGLNTLRMARGESQRSQALKMVYEGLDQESFHIETDISVQF